MRVLLVEPGKEPRTIEVDGSNESLQKLVDSTIYRALFPFEDSVALCCDEEACYHDYQKPNRMVQMSTHRTIIHGPFFLCGMEDEDWTSLTDEQVERYSKLYRYPEEFIKQANGTVMVVRKMG